MRGPRRVLAIVAIVGFNLIVACALVELIFLLLLHVPRLTASLPRPARRLVQQVYRHFNRSLIQFDPDCAQYDPGLTYTLKPGACTFANLEFRTAVRVNHVGVRDDEAALAAPDIIVLGDSHAMGWGVEHDETFSHVLADKTGQRVLDAGISSYGTVREMMLLDRLDVSGLRLLVIQYSDNDLPENRAFREHGNRLPITSEAEYDRVTQYYASQHSYFPGKYLYRLVMKVSHLETPEPADLAMTPVAPADEARLFLYAVEHASHQRLDDVQLVVLEINESLQDRAPFIRALDAVRREASNPPFVQRLIALDLSTTLTPRDFFVLDDHMTAEGHRVVGDALARVVRDQAGQPR
jgi:hypothetical protein